jgi:hypothetical protein
MSINRPGDGWTSEFADAAPVEFVVGITLGGLFGFSLTRRSGSFLGLVSATLLPLLTGTAGIALGLILFLPKWSRAEEYGRLLPSRPGRPGEGWAEGAWIQYWLPIWLPVTFSTVAVLILILIVLTTLRTHRRAKHLTELVASGERTVGVITEVHPTGLEVQGMHRLAVTVRFRDTVGTDRWVTKRALFEFTDLPRVGDPAVVWFEATRPECEDDVVVGWGRGTSTGPP